MAAKTPAGDRILSVYSGPDYKLLPLLIKYYCRGPRPLILDATYGAGRFWKLQGDMKVIGLDILPGADIQADNTKMIPVASGSVDVVVYDPPHLSDQCTSSGREHYIALYGDAGYSPNVSHLFTPFLKEAYRILRFPGLLICKITDQVNRRKSEWQHVDLMLMARDQGFTCDDLIVKIRKNPLISGAWKNNYHARKNHCFFLIFRKRRNNGASA